MKTNQKTVPAPKKAGKKSFVRKAADSVSFRVQQIKLFVKDTAEDVKSDVEATRQRDPAARNNMEVILLYSGVHAMIAYRVAHRLYEGEHYFSARTISQLARHFTGIEIHPGARIGKGLMIDHGMGVVIGETATIGNNVKLYQGVTIGAKSFRMNDDGSLVKGVKRHPDISDDVVIYAGATVLGGSTLIGKGVVIGGNAWVTHSVESGKVIPSNYVG